jgi:diketogulonate reductase-like aldo/keto reductase
MQYKQLETGFKLPLIGLGTWKVGGRREKDTSNDAQEIRAIRSAIDLGISHIDTAEGYGAGHSEELVGQAIQPYNRDRFIITTKVNHKNLAYDDVIAAARGSLRRLRSSYIDLYLIHAPNPDIPLKETMRAMDCLVDECMVRNIGVSNFSVEQMKEAQSYARNRIVANQIEYNLLVRDKGKWSDNMESEIIPYCQQNNILVIAHRPLGNARLVKPGYKSLDDIAAKHDKTQSQVALNWLLAKKNIVTIVKASNMMHLRENLGAAGWSLSEEDMAVLDAGIN